MREATLLGRLAEVQENLGELLKKLEDPAANLQELHERAVHSLEYNLKVLMPMEKDKAIERER